MMTPESIAIAFGTSLLVGGAVLYIAGRPAAAGEAVASPTGGGAAVVLEPLPVAATGRRSRPVFICRDATPVVFSDRPCGEHVESRTLRVTAAEPRAGNVASTIARAPAAETRPKPEPAPAPPRTDAKASRCDDLHAQLDRLDARMRAGYPAREATRLWARWRELHDDLYDTRC